MTDDGIKDASEMQILGMTSILRTGINSILAGHVVQALCMSDMNSYMGVSLHVSWHYSTKW